MDDVSFDVMAGEVHVLMGENGAGKSTLMKIIDGIYRPDAGELFLYGKKKTIHSPKEAQSEGISMIHQELNNVLEMTIAENIFLGREPGKCGLLDKKRMLKEARTVLELIQQDIDPSVKIKDLSVAQMQMVEIAKAISVNARIIIMDEPTSAISDKEVDKLFEIIHMLRAKDVGIIYISHKMNEVFRIADRITVLRDGRSVATYPASELDKAKLVTLMVGRELVNVYPPGVEHPIGEVVMKVSNLCCGDKLKDISFSLRAGEILGIGGLVGAGRSELLETLFGIRRSTGGSVEILGDSTPVTTPNNAIARKLAFVTEDRKRSGLNLKASVKCDISIATLRNYCYMGRLIQNSAENAAVDKGIRLFNLRTPSRNQLVINLSGGNQQKVILARWLLADPRIIMMDEPTRGIDVGAKYEIYTFIKQLAQQGKAVLMVSSEMPEIIGVCDRVLMLHEGRVTGELPKDQMNQETMMAMAAGIGV